MNTRAEMIIDRSNPRVTANRRLLSSVTDRRATHDLDGVLRGFCELFARARCVRGLEWTATRLWDLCNKENRMIQSQSRLIELDLNTAIDPTRLHQYAYLGEELFRQR